MAQYQDRGATGSSLTGITALCPWARHNTPSLVLVQPRKTCPLITERLLMGHKESNQTNKTKIFLLEITPVCNDGGFLCNWTHKIFKCPTFLVYLFLYLFINVPCPIIFWRCDITPQPPLKFYGRTLPFIAEFPEIAETYIVDVSTMHNYPVCKE